MSYAIVAESDMKRAVSFYRDVIGLPLRFETPEWTEFATEGATLAFHTNHCPDSEREESGPTPAGRCCPGPSVPTLDEFYRWMFKRTVPCVPESKEVFGTRMAQYVDPDGLAISVSEERSGG